MRMAKLLCLLALVASVAVGQKQASLPPDLPPYGAEKPLQLPAVSAVKLSNGLTVWLVSHRGFPKVAFALAVRGGLAADPSDRPGISELLSKTVDQGTKSRSAKQIAEELQAAGGDLVAGVGKDSVEISITVLSSRLGPAMAVLADLVQNASFPDSEVALAKRNLADSLRQRESEPSFLATRAMAEVLFGHHPYHVVAPTQESIAASTATDLRRVFSQRFRPDQAVLVAVGDFANDRMLEAIKANFDSWKAPSQPPLEPPSPPVASPDHAVFLVPRPGSVQTTLELGTFAPRRGDADFEAAEVADAIYGSTFSSRLVTNIREDKGYTYSPFADLSNFRMSGLLITRADVRNEVTAPSLNEIQYELNRLATTTPSEEELSKAKHYLVGAEAVRFQEQTAVAHRLATTWVDGLPPNEIAQHTDKISRTSLADVDQAARKYFPAYRTSIVAVGEEKVIRDAVAPFGIPVKALPQ